MKKGIIWIFVLVLLAHNSLALTSYYDPVSPDIQTGWGCTGVDCGVGQYEVLNDGARQGVSTPSTASDFISKTSNVAAISEHQVSSVSESTINYITLWAYVETGSNFELTLAIENNGVEQVSSTYATGLTPQWVNVNWTDADLATIGNLSATIDGSKNGPSGPTTGYVYSWYFEINYNDSTPPAWSNNLTAPISPVTYNSSQTYQFNVTWTDSNSVDTVTMEHNFTGTLTNYSITGNNGNEYYYDYGSLPAGTYRWRMFANDSFSNVNATNIFNYVVNKATSATNLTLNNSAANISVESGDYVNITGIKLAGESNINLYNDGTIINSGNGPLNNYTRFVAPGLYNITAEYPESQNYSSSHTTYWVNVTDTVAPNALINSISPAPAQYGVQNVVVNWGFTELNVDNYYVNITYPNGSLLGQFTSNITLNHTTSLNALGTYNVTVFVNDTSENSDTTSQTFLVRDTIAPSSSNLTETPSDPSTYNPSQEYEFNITWTDLHGVTSVRLVFDGVEYFDHTNSSGEFSKTFTTLSAGVHNYTWYANDSSNNQGSSGAQTFTVNKATPQINLTLNGIENNLTINEGTQSEVNLSLITPATGFLELYRDGVLIQSGNNLVSNLSTLNDGYYNFTGTYPETENYTSTSATYFLRVNALPVSTLISPSPGHTDVDGNFSLTCQGTDTEGLQSITVYHNFTQPFGANQTVVVSGTDSTIVFNFTNIPDGTYLWNCLVTDTYNATDFALNRTIIVNSSANQPPIPAFEFPPNNYITNNQTIDFNCSATDPEGLNNISLWWDVGGTFERNETINVSGLSNSTIFTKNNIPEGNHLWACEAGDAFGQTAITTNRTFLVDITAPNINLHLLENNTNLTNSFGFFNFTPTDNFDSSIYCNLSIDGTTEANSSASNNTVFGTTINNIADGTHYYNVTCIDNANNVNTSETRIFNVYTIGFPINLSIVLGGDNQSTILNWSSLVKATSYNVYITNNYTSGFGITPNITGITDSNYTDLNANASRKRFYRISAVNGPAENISNRTAGKIGADFLDNGFHLVSFPFNKTYVLNNGSNNGYTLNTQPFDCVSQIYRWNGSLFEQTVNEGNQNYLPAIGSESFLSLNPMESYWLLTNNSCNITYLGIVPTEEVKVSLNNPFYLAGWYSAHDVILGEEAVVGNPLNISPANKITNIYRYNSTSDLFEGTTHFIGYGWWPSFESQQFTSLNPARGYYFGVSPSANWTHDPEFTS